MDKAKLTVEYVYREIKPKCSDCKRRLGRASIKDWASMCGLDYFLGDEGALCLRCGRRSSRELLDTLSEARYGESGQYRSWADVDVDDFPGI